LKGDHLEKAFFVDLEDLEPDLLKPEDYLYETKPPQYVADLWFLAGAAHVNSGRENLCLVQIVCVEKDRMQLPVRKPNLHSMGRSPIVPSPMFSKK